VLEVFYVSPQQKSVRFSLVGNYSKALPSFFLCLNSWLIFLFNLPSSCLWSSSV